MSFPCRISSSGAVLDIQSLSPYWKPIGAPTVSSKSTKGILAKAPNAKIIVMQDSLPSWRMFVYKRNSLQASASRGSRSLKRPVAYLIRSQLAPQYPLFRNTANGLTFHAQSLATLRTRNAPAVEPVLCALASTLDVSGACGTPTGDSSTNCDKFFWYLIAYYAAR